MIDRKGLEHILISRGPTFGAELD
ncbi:hypothetical protein [Enterococcus malodoratus]|nr:hypothetical protein [Enterococcus malodoratus]